MAIETTDCNLTPLVANFLKGPLARFHQLPPDVVFKAFRKLVSLQRALTLPNSFTRIFPASKYGNVVLARFYSETTLATLDVGPGKGLRLDSSVSILQVNLIRTLTCCTVA